MTIAKDQDASTSVPELEGLLSEVRSVRAARPIGHVSDVGAGLVQVTGLSGAAQVGTMVEIFASSGARLRGEILRLGSSGALVLPSGPLDGIGLGDEVLPLGPLKIAPCDAWIGRIIDSAGMALDGRDLPRGPRQRSVLAAPINPAERKPLGVRLETGMGVFNTLLPLVQAQRIGLFAGSGVGKSTLLAHFASHMQADVVVIALIGERGRELREFVDKVLGPKGMARSVVVAATSDQSPLERRRCAWTAMAVAEHFRDQGKQVLLLAEPVADMMRGVLDGHVILDRAIAERGRYPAIDAVKSVSRSLPEAASRARLCRS